MAVSGRRLGGSVKESDFLYDFPRSPCEKDGQNVEAIKYCADCEENLCPTCLVHHQKFAVTRGHTVLDQVQTSLGQTKQLPSQRCSKHGGKIVDVFCPDHDSVGCSTCISVDHSACKGKKFIPDVAAGFKTSREVKQLETEMKTLMLKLDALKKLKEDNQTRLQQDKDDLKKEIRSVRKKMNEQLDKMEKVLLQEADTKFDVKIDAIQKRIAEVDDMLVKVKQAMGQLKGDTNEADIFVTFKIMKRSITEEMQPMREIIQDHFECSLELLTDDNTKLIMEGGRIFASITDKYILQGAVYEKEIDSRVNADKEICQILVMCALPDGCISLADYKNKTLKKLDPITYNVSTLITLPDCPTGICLVDNSRIAVSLVNQKKIQFVSHSGKVKLQNSFSVGDRCRELAHCDGLLYVCCGGSRIPERNEGPGHVEVYNCTGELLRSLYEKFDLPTYLSVVDDVYHTTIYCGDFCGVLARGTDGVVKYEFPTVIDCDLPFCLIGTDQLCIGEFSTGNIYIQTRKDKRILIKSNDLKGKPECLYFDIRSSQLFVVVDVDDDDDSDFVIKAFKLKM